MTDLKIEFVVREDDPFHKVGFRYSGELLANAKEEWVSDKFFRVMIDEIVSALMEGTRQKLVGAYKDWAKEEAASD